MLGLRRRCDLIVVGVVAVVVAADAELAGDCTKRLSQTH
jgi:hypothetical protein